MHKKASREGSGNGQAGPRVPRGHHYNRQPPAFLPQDKRERKRWAKGGTLGIFGIWNLRHSETRSMCNSLLGLKAADTEKEQRRLKENAFVLSNMAASGHDPELEVPGRRPQGVSTLPISLLPRHAGQRLASQSGFEDRTRSFVPSPQTYDFLSPLAPR